MGALTSAFFTAVQLLFNKGILYCIAAFASYVYLKFTAYIFGHRFKLYNYHADHDPEKLAFFIPHEEYELESPQNAMHLKKKLDSMLFTGMNSHSENLTVQISRLPGGQIHCSLVLRLGDGRTYVLPEECTVQPDVGEPHTYGSSRFKLQCIAPMRRWRIFFNGNLKETKPGQGEEEKYVHVRFAFLWTSSSDVFDYYNDMSPTILTDVAATQSSWSWPPLLLLQRLKSMFNSYGQCGMFLGNVTVEKETEREVYLWGCRTHLMGRITDSKDGNFEDMYVNSENGTFIHLGLMNIPGMIRNFNFGFVMKPNGYIVPIEKCLVLEDDNLEGSKKYRCFADGQEYTIKVEKEDTTIKFDQVTSLTQGKVFLNVMKGRCVIFEGKIRARIEPAPKMQNTLFSAERGLPSKNSPVLSVPIEDPYCQFIEVSGGKGSSLAKLCIISKELKTFTVPKGIVVTTTAYQSFIQDRLRASLRKFEKEVWKLSANKVKTECERLIDEISNSELPESVKQSIELNLKKEFGSDLESPKFAVRSSSAGEDTEQMSAAGQMETFLGCIGLEQIFEAVKKCWASQFSNIAVQYKRRYGQQLNTPMAVVIQEMVPCDAAGVMFTCDPVTGNPSYISITANYGLGESVVGASADPDTITLERDPSGANNFHSQSTGKKRSKTVMDDSGGTREIPVDEESSNEYSISRETAYFLGEIAVKLEEIFGNPRDIEWGTLSGDIYLFQSRPITSLDIETDFEIKHSFDSSIRREDEYSTTANVGEVMPGAVSPLGINVMQRNCEVAMARQKYVRWEGETLPDTPYITKNVVMVMNHPFFIISDAFFRFSEKEGDEISNHTKALTVAMFGRVIDDKKIFDMARDRHSGSKQVGMSLLGKIYLLFVMFFSGYLHKKMANHVERFYIPVKRNSSSKEILYSISRNFSKISYATSIHLGSSFSSAFWNNAILTLLGNAKGAWDNDVYSDFAYLLSTCSHVESADVPSAIQKLSVTISRCMEPEEFKKMSFEGAFEWLQGTSTEAGKLFRDFLKKHGHRCLKEFDVHSLTWELDPKPLIKVLQDLVRADMKDSTEKETESFGTILSHMKVKLNFFERLKLRFLLPNCQRGVRERERSKSSLVKGYNKLREPFYKLADAMFQEGRLPNQELLFFFNVEEVRQLIRTRSPRLVAKAFRRWKFHPEMDRLIFPEIMTGIPRPINMDEDAVVPENGFTMTGVPVSQGVIKGTARIVMNFEDAHQIQLGDILITYSTDIGWSPYFALLSGVATEIGGLISHGAVVAREYGLPCVVNLHGASRAFKSGDHVLLDGNKGILKKLENM